MWVQSKMRWLKGSLGIVAGLFSMLLCCGVVFVFLASDRMAKLPVGAEIPARMYFFVLCNNEPEIIVSEELEKYVREPRCSFTISVGQQEHWNQELAKRSREDSLVSWALAVKQIADNKQEVEVVFSDDDRTIYSWYEVEDRKVTPRYVKDIHMGLGFRAVIYGFGIWLICWWLGRKLYRKFRSE